MWRFRQQLTKSECEIILSKAASGTLALLGDDGYPYAVPISHELYKKCGKRVNISEDCSC